jgi:hypothetical protein
MGKWQVGIVVAFIVVYGLTVLLTGHAEYLWVGLALLVLVGGYAALNLALSRRVMAKHGGSFERAVADADEDIPSAHLFADDGERPAGDTPEAHDEITAHDLPLSHPGRKAAEEQAAAGDGTTAGHTEGGAAGEGGSEGRFRQEAEGTTEGDLSRRS